MLIRTALLRRLPVPAGLNTIFFSNKAARFLSTLKETNAVRSPTIYALSTAPSRAAIGLIRVSGPATDIVYKKLTGYTQMPKPRHAVVRKLYNPSLTDSQQILDECVVLFFPGPRSYTGENLLEFQCHGGNAVINAILKAIESLHSPSIPIRYAEAGEFSKRAFQNGRFDLTEIEGINDLIHAETESQRVSSLDSMQGKTKELFLGWREQIVNNIALLTTVIDFGEDHDIDEIDDLFNRVDTNIHKLENDINAYLQKVNRSEILLEGIKMTLLGPPNAGKSSLLNVLANSETAIVSDIEGTTRDIIDVPLDINGYKVVIGDTAGIRDLEYANSIEKEGIRRAKTRSQEADLVLVVLPCDVKVIDPELVAHIKELNNSCKVNVVLNKSDLLISKSEEEKLTNEISTTLQIPVEDIQFVSCKEMTGVESLVSTLTKEFKELTWTENSDPVVISRRAKDIITKDVLFGFEQFYQSKEMDDIVLASEGLKYSIQGIGKITGQAVGVEEILGVVFSSFCIGK